MYGLKTVGSAKKFKKTWVFGSPICNFPYSCTTGTISRFGEESCRNYAGLQSAPGRPRTHCLFDSTTSLLEGTLPAALTNGAGGKNVNVIRAE